MFNNKVNVINKQTFSKLCWTPNSTLSWRSAGANGLMSHTLTGEGRREGGRKREREGAREGGRGGGGRERSANGMYCI